MVLQTKVTRAEARLKIQCVLGEMMGLLDYPENYGHVLYEVTLYTELCVRKTLTPKS